MCAKQDARWLRGRVQKLVVAVLRSSEEEDVGLGTMDGVVNPAATLLDADGAPLVLAEQAVLREVFRDVLRENYVSGKDKERCERGRG